TRLEGLADREAPRLMLAPWSPYLLVPGDAADLNEQLDALVRRHPEQLGDGRFLLELLPLATAGVRPPGLTVEGRSLGLAVRLACWPTAATPTAGTGAAHSPRGATAKSCSRRDGRQRGRSLVRRCGCCRYPSATTRRGRCAACSASWVWGEVR